MTGVNHNSVAQAGLQAWQRGDAATALAAFETVASAGVASPRLLLLLAQARAETHGDVDAALDKVLEAEPRNIAALIMKGDRAADERAAGSFYGLALGSAAEADRRDPDTARLLLHAQTRMSEAAANYLDHLKSSVADLDAGPRFAEAVAIVAGEKQVFLQQPTNFFFPGLPHRQFYEAEEFDWAADLVAAAPAILAELEAVLASADGFRPYVEADPGRANKGHALLNDPQWSAFRLFENGKPATGNAERCPATMAALGAMPMPVIEARSPMALFSVLKPHTHIPAHNGMLNTRLICHLPLIVPNGCRLRVGNETRAVEAGKLMIFDDSVLHEAWNDSDETRIVLLFEIWRPELTARERPALVQLYEAVGFYTGKQ